MDCSQPVLGLGTAQRIILAALVVAGSNFDIPNVLVMCMVDALLMLLGSMIFAGELGKRVPAPTANNAGTTNDPGQSI